MVTEKTKHKVANSFSGQKVQTDQDMKSLLIRKFESSYLLNAADCIYRTNDNFDFRNSAIVVDGVHVAHGVAEWQPKGLKRSPPQHTKDDDSHVTYDEETQKWTLFRNGVKYDT